jgi:hypothetical protein
MATRLRDAIVWIDHLFGDVLGPWMGVMIAIAFFGIAFFLISFVGLGLISTRFNLGISETAGKSVGALFGLAVSFLVARRMRGSYEALVIWFASSLFGVAIFVWAAGTTNKFGLWLAWQTL